MMSKQPGYSHLPLFQFLPVAAGILLIVATGLPPAFAANPAGHWSSEFNRPGIDGDIAATAEYNGDLIVGGRFELAGNPPIRNIARWDGRQWRALGNGLTGDELYEGSVTCLAVYREELIAGGTFRHAGEVPVEGLARWDGSEWRGLDAGPRRIPLNQFTGTEIHALTIYNARLVAGGVFDSAGSGAASSIAAWDGDTWSSLGARQLSFVNTMCEFRGDLIVNSLVPSLDDTSRIHLQRWDGTAWSLIPGSSRIFAYDMVVHENRLIVGGGFQRKLGAQMDFIAAWDGSGWHEFSPGFTMMNDVASEQHYGVSRLTVHGGALIVGGAFSRDGLTSEHLVRWNDGEWISLEPHEEHFDCCSTITLSGIGEVTALGTHDGDLVVAGHIDTLGTAFVNNIARWDGGSWRAYGCGGGFPPSYEYGWTRVTSWKGSMMVGGHFRGGPLLWSGNSWLPLGTDNGQIFDILIHEGDVVIARSADEHVIRFTGHSWVPLGHEFFAVGLEVHDDALVGSGYMDSDVSGNSSVARWDGNAWQRIGTPFAGEPWRLTVFRGELVATINRFAPPSSGGRLVRWTGAEWEELGSTGPEGWIYDLAIFENELVAAGYFLEMDGVPARNIARWNGERWAPLGEGVAAGEAEGAIYSVEPYGDRLAVGGRFQVAGTIPAGNIAFWDGFDWTTAGSGTDGLIWDLEVLDGDLYAVGQFTLAGDQPSYGIARWTSTPEGHQCFPLTPLVLAPAYPNPFRQSTRIEYSLAERGHSRITVVDVLGRPAVELVNKVQAAGAHSITWDGCDRDGRKVSSGVYYIVIETGRTRATRKIIRLR